MFRREILPRGLQFRLTASRRAFPEARKTARPAMGAREDTQIRWAERMEQAELVAAAEEAARMEVRCRQL